METLHRKTATITGGGSGTGKAIAVALVREGAHVIVTSRRAKSRPPQNDSEVCQGVPQVEDLASAALFLLKPPARVNIENIGDFIAEGPRRSPRRHQ